jgi:glycerol uptake facilitator-like aquaporin
MAIAITQPAEPVVSAFFLEILLTGILVFVIASVTLRPHVPPALVAPIIGSTVALGALMGGPISGASMNPVRSLAPALISGQLTHLWIYLTAPFVGGVVGIVLYQLLHWESHYEHA